MLYFINCVFSAVPGLIGMTLWAVKILTDEAYSPLSLGWSFGLGVAHCVLALIGGSVAFHAAFRTEPQYLPLVPQ